MTWGNMSLGKYVKIYMGKYVDMPLGKYDCLYIKSFRGKYEKPTLFMGKYVDLPMNFVALSQLRSHIPTRSVGYSITN